jgi:hypothetical protein
MSSAATFNCQVSMFVVFLVLVCVESDVKCCFWIACVTCCPICSFVGAQLCVSAR